jgi:hypothetical protein
MFLNQTELGTLFGATSHEIGRWLDQLGLRDGKWPTGRAFDGGYVSKTSLANGFYYYKWDKRLTVAALEQASHRQVPQKSADRIEGPFSMVESAPNAFQILSGNGTVSIWAIGRENADDLARLLNLAYKHGKFGGGQ